MTTVILAGVLGVAAVIAALFHTRSSRKTGPLRLGVGTVVRQTSPRQGKRA
jgi:hypothetical protein